MILADKIINERKKNGWSQEELAEKLSVSRQSVSKWEGALAAPDLQKILLMSELFGVSTDYLLKDEMEDEVTAENVSDSSASTPVRKVNLEEANEFIKFKKWSLPRIALGILLCITCPVALIILSGLSVYTSLGISEALAVGIGLAFLFGQIVIGVITFIVVDEKGKRFDYFEKKDIDTEYGVVGLARELRDKYQRTYTTGLIVGVSLFIICAVPLIFAALAGASEMFIIVMVAVLLLSIGIAMYIIVNVCGTMGTYNMLLQEREYTGKNKANSRRLAPFISIYWLLTTSLFLGYSFITKRWDYSWVFFAIAGVFFPVYRRIVKLALKIEDDED